MRVVSSDYLFFPLDFLTANFMESQNVSVQHHAIKVSQVEVKLDLNLISSSSSRSIIQLRQVEVDLARLELYYYIGLYSVKEAAPLEN
jgi:hypothetical protein